MPLLCVWGHCHAGRPSNKPFSMLLLREGGCWPKSRDTWPPSILPSIRCSCPVPFAKKHPQSMFPPPCFMVGMVFLRLYSSFFLQTRRVEFMPESSILVSSDHMTFSHASSGSSRWSLANFRRAWTCAGLSRGTLRMLQDFNPTFYGHPGPARAYRRICSLGWQHSQGGKKDRCFRWSFGHSFGIIALISTSYNPLVILNLE